MDWKLTCAVDVQRLGTGVCDRNIICASRNISAVLRQDSNSTQGVIISGYR